MEESHVNVTIMISSLSRIHIFLNVIVGMNRLPKFVASRQNIITKNPPQIIKYMDKESPKEIIHFILKGSGKGPECEHYAKYCFPSLGSRLQDDTHKSGYDHKRQGDADRNSYQGWWFNYTNAKDDLIEITSNEHLDLLSKRITP